MVNLRQAFRGAATATDDEQKRWVVYLTGEPEDDRLLEIVGQVADNASLHITLAYVVEVQQSMPLDAELPADLVRGEEILGEAEQFTARCVGSRHGNVTTELLQARSAGAAVVDQAIDEGADAILVGCAMKKRFGKVTAGENVDYILRNAPCEVIVVRAPVTGPNREGESAA